MADPPRPEYSARPGEAVRVFMDAHLNFAIGNGRVTVASDDAVFVDGVIRDIGRLAHRSEGQIALQRGDVLGHPVRIAKPDVPTEPPNAWIVPDDLAAASSLNAVIGEPEDGRAVARGTGAGCGSTIVYDPADWPRQGDPDSPQSAEVLLVALRQANANAEGRSDPSLADWGVPA